MKKLLFILLILFTPMMVLADSVSPQIFGYEAVVINKNGAKVDDYDNGKTIPYNTKIQVENEYDEGLYACLKSNEVDCFTISAKDIAPVKEEVLPKDLIKKDYQGTTLDKYENKLYVYDTDGIVLKKGPSDAYKTYNITVPFKKTIKTIYAVHFEGHGGGYTWFYVDDGDYKGWVANDDKVANYSNQPIMMFGYTKFYDVGTDKEITTIPPETVINEYFYGDNVYLAYKGNFGYIKASKYDDGYKFSSYGYKSALGYIFTKESVNMKNADGKSITAIPKGERIKILYGEMEDDDSFDYPWHETAPICSDKDNCLYYIEYNGTKGFVDGEDVVALFHEDKVTTLSFDKELQLYDINYLEDNDRLSDDKISLEKYSKEHETNITIPANTKITSYMEYYLVDSSMDDHVSDGSKSYTINLIKYKNNIGWIVSEEKDDRVFHEESYEQRDYDEPTTNPVMDKTKEDVLKGVMIALIVSSLALISLFMINKSKIKNEG